MRAVFQNNLKHRPFFWPSLSDPIRWQGPDSSYRWVRTKLARRSALL